MAAREWSETRYARAPDGAYLAYQEMGQGLPLLLLLDGFIPIEVMDDEPHLARVLRRFATFSQVIRFDRRGIGLSDRMSPDSSPSLDQWVDDAEAILDATGVRQAAVLGDRAGGLVAIALAAERPQRVSALMLVNAYPKLLRAPDHPVGEDPEAFQNLRDRIIDRSHPDGPFDIVAHVAPTVADDVRFRSWWDRAGRLGASPGTARLLRETVETIDVRDMLARIAVPTLVLHYTGITVPSIGQGRFLAERIPNTRFVELAGQDSVWYVSDTEPLLEEIQTFVTGTAPDGIPVEDVATVMFTDIVGSTELAHALGSGPWSQLLDDYERIAHNRVAEFSGRYIKTTGDGSLASFERAEDALACARAVRDGAEAVALPLRVGLHTGQVERQGRDITGATVHVAARVMALAGPGEIWVSTAVNRPLARSGIEFEDRGEHELRGVPGVWRLFAVAG